MCPSSPPETLFFLSWNTNKPTLKKGGKLYNLEIFAYTIIVKMSVNAFAQRLRTCRGDKDAERFVS